jgi:putative CocE/NonD family hydrolase
MRDGVTLYADVYRPKDDGKYPVLLQRTPYNKDGDREFGLRAAARGYVVIIQDVRGRYTSEGEWYTFKHEPNDGYDTVEWAGTLPYSDGKVGMFGGSYVGATQMLAAIAHPPHLAGICPVVTASNYHSNWTYQGGAFAQWFNQSWTSGLAQDTIARNTRGRSNALKGMAELPLGNFPLFNPPADGRPPEATATLAQYYLDWIAHPNEDGYWKQWSIEGHFSDITVPALHIVAWYDLFQDGSFRNYIGIKAHGANEAARNGQRLITIVGGHAGNGPIIGDVDFGPDSKFDEDWRDARLVRLPVQGREEPVRGQAREAVRDGREPVARRGRLAARPRAQHEVLPALGRQGELAARQRHAVDDGARGGDRGSIRLRSGEPRADDRRAALLRRLAPETGPAGSASCRSARRCPRVFDAAAGSRHGSHGTGDARAVREVVGGGYRLHGQAPGRQA